MSTSIDTIRTGAKRRDPDLSGGVIDVTEVALENLEEFVGDGSVHFERHHGRTYAVTDR